MNFTALTNEELADQIGKLYLASKTIETLLKNAKEEFKDRATPKIVGNYALVTVSEGARSILDVEEVKKFLGDKRVGRFTVDQAISTVRVLTPDGKKINPVLDN